MYRTVVSYLLLLSSVGFMAGCRDRDGGQKKKALHLPAGTPKRPQGMAALVVNTGAAEPFTRQDVITYFQTHNLPRNSGSLSQFQVDTLEFLTSKEATDRLQGVSTGLSDGDRVGFVTLTGTFVFTGPPKAKPATVNRAYAVFDATTGNLLMVGSLDQVRQPQ